MPKVTEAFEALFKQLKGVVDECPVCGLRLTPIAETLGITVAVAAETHRSAHAVTYQAEVERRVEAARKVVNDWQNKMPEEGKVDVVEMTTALDDIDQVLVQVQELWD